MKKTTGEKKNWILSGHGGSSSFSGEYADLSYSSQSVGNGIWIIGNSGNSSCTGISRNENDWRKRTSQLGWTC